MVASAFKLVGRTVGFQMGSYDIQTDLIIDPWTQAPILRPTGTLFGNANAMEQVMLMP